MTPFYDKRKLELNKLRDRYFACIYKNIIKNNYKQTFKDLKKETLYNIYHDLSVSPILYKQSKNLAKRIHKIAYDKVSNKYNLELVLFMLSSNLAFTYFDKIINKDIRSYEAKIKKEYLKDLLQTQRENNKLKSNDLVKNIFYLCSVHSDCAKDHLEYQGKIYVDKYFKSQISDKTQIKAILDYINNNKIKYIQDIVSSPVWLITRPNCRHYFIPISILDAFNYDLPTLISINLNTKDYVLERYKRRLSLHKILKRVRNNKKINELIKKDKELINKRENIVK